MTSIARFLTTSDKWKSQAICKGGDVETFYPDIDEPVYEAKLQCLVCPVRKECLADALHYDDPYGVWGMADPRERRRIARMQGDAGTTWLDFVIQNDTEIFEMCKPMEEGRMGSAFNVKK